MSLPARPKLRSVEVLPVVENGRRVVILRDPLGLTSGIAVLPLPLVPIVMALDGSRTLDAVQGEARRYLGDLPREVLEDVVRALDESHFLEGEAFEAHRAEVVRGFRQAPERLPAHAGMAYERTPDALGRQIDAMYESAARSAPAPPPMARIGGLVSPHIDPQRGARAYGHAYRALREACDAEVFVVFGTAHAPTERPWALTEKTYGTPLGPVPTDAALVREVERRYGGDARRDEIVHLNEHSIEFQAVMLRHAFPDRAIAILPILAGRIEPGAPETEDLIEAVKSVLAEDGRPSCVIAGADLAHVGPRFGDPEPYDAEARKDLETRDRESLERVVTADPGGFFEHATEDEDTRRVCGTAPIYATLRVLGGARGDVLHYEQSVDPMDGSIVSYAAMTLHVPSPKASGR